MKSWRGKAIATWMAKALREELSDEVLVELDEPASAEGMYHLDVVDGGWSATLSVTAEGDIALAAGPSDDTVLGELADEHIADWRQAVRRVIELARTRASTAPDPGPVLTKLRESQGVDQRTLAARLGVSQPAVSGQERRNDIRLSTVLRSARALECKVTLSFEHESGMLELHDGVGILWRARHDVAQVRAFKAQLHGAQAPLLLNPAREAVATPIRLEALSVIREDTEERFEVKVSDEAVPFGRAPADPGADPPDWVAIPHRELGIGR